MIVDLLKKEGKVTLKQVEKELNSKTELYKEYESIPDLSQYGFTHHPTNKRQLEREVKELQGLFEKYKKGVVSSEVIERVMHKYYLVFCSPSEFVGKTPESLPMKLKEAKEKFNIYEIKVLTPQSLTTIKNSTLKETIATHKALTDPVVLGKVAEGWMVIDAWGNDFTPLRRVQAFVKEHFTKFSWTFLVIPFVVWFYRYDILWFLTLNQVFGVILSVISLAFLASTPGTVFALDHIDRYFEQFKPSRRKV